jgi:hypothetical protein
VADFHVGVLALQKLHLPACGGQPGTSGIRAAAPAARYPPSVADFHDLTVVLSKEYNKAG